MTALRLLASLLLLAACSKPAALTFCAVGIAEIAQRQPVHRAVFVAGERPTLVIDGPRAFGHEAFADVYRDGKRMDVSPPQRVTSDGLWLSMGQLPIGSYRVELFLDGRPEAWLEFKVVK